MTPKLKLKEAERKASLSEILKPCMPGNTLTTTSMHMILAPITHAIKCEPSTTGQVLDY